MEIIFDATEDAGMPDLPFEEITAWLSSVAESYKKRIKRLSYLFCTDDEILDANKRFLGHDYYTDIITFDYSGKSGLSGDMLISLDTVKTNSEKFDGSYNNELLRVIVHGLLHLCGFPDKLPGEREIMETQEDKALSLFKK